MKKSIALAVLFAMAGTSAWAEKKPAAAKQEMSPAVFKVDTVASKVHWIGKKVTGQHDGNVGVKSGEVLVAGNAVIGGTVEIDMTSISVDDLKDAAANEKLTGHLKSSDFFSVDKFPSASFTSTSITPSKAGGSDVTVNGDLTIKGATHPISFPATAMVSGGKAEVVAKGVKVDRTLYDIRYGSGKFFQGLGDKVIYDEFLLDIHLVAKK